MADLNEPKKETVRITLPPRTTNRPTVPVEKDTARINLPARPPGTAQTPPPDAVPPASPAVRPPPPFVAPKPLPPAAGTPSQRPPAPPTARPPAPVASGAIRPPLPPMGSKTKAGESETLAPLPRKPGSAPVVTPIENRSASAAPRKETARIAPTPDTPMKATVRLSGAAPSSPAPAGVIRTAALPVANPPRAGLVESVPLPICWALLGISAFTLLIQIWTYLA